MPIRRPNNNDPDWMARRQDEELKSLEKRISALYDEANTELTDEFNRFYTDYQLEYERRLAMVESGEITEDRFQTWCRNHILQSNRYQATLIMLTDILVNADVAAMALVNNQLPLTLAESYDFVSSLGFEAADRAGISIGTFQIYNAESVQAIIRDNPDLLPVVDLPEDELWNRNHINNEIAQAIIRGDTMPNIARRLQNVAQMDDNAAIRNARTSMTAAENLGRTESASRLRSRGIPIEEVWSATHDARTRDTHLLLDGTKRDEKTGKFGVGIITVPLRFPADPEGEGKEIYNCRCRLNVQLEGIDHTRDDEIYENFMRENYPNDWEAIESQRADQKSAEYRREQERISALERQQRLREERQVQPEIIPDNAPQGVLNIIGDKGQAIPVETLIQTINPNYPDKGYTDNCQRCAMCYELGRRGYDVEAMAFDGHYPSTAVFLDESSQRRAGENRDTFIDGSAYHRSDRYPFNRSARTTSNSIRQAMTDWGDGARATLSVTWRNGGGDHIVNIENFGGNIRIIDTQCGRIYDDIENYMAQTRCAEAELRRMDILQFRDDPFLDYLRISCRKRG